MTDEAKRKMLTSMTGETDEDVLSTYLTLAEDKVMSHAYPFGGRVASIPAKYEVVQVEIAAFMLNKRGAEGETSHSENGVTRRYDDGDIPAALLRRIIPVAEVMSKCD